MKYKTVTVEANIHKKMKLYCTENDITTQKFLSYVIKNGIENNVSLEDVEEKK